MLLSLGNFVFSIILIFATEKRSHAKIIHFDHNNVMFTVASNF